MSEYRFEDGFTVFDRCRMLRFKVTYIGIVIFLLASICCKESHAATITYTYDSLNRPFPLCLALTICLI